MPISHQWLERGFAMSKVHLSMRDRTFLAFAICAGLVATLGVTRYQLNWNSTFFIPNALMYGVSQICVLLSLLPFRPRAVSVASVALLNACYLVLFNAWVFSGPVPDGATWGIYLIALCVEAAFAATSVVWIRAHNVVASWQAALITTSFALAGVLAVHAFFGSIVWLSRS